MDQLVWELIATSAAVKRSLNDVLREFNLGLSGYRMLEIAHTGGAQGVKIYSAHKAYSHRPDIPRNMDRLEAKGFIERFKREGNNRDLYVRLTDDGIHAYMRCRTCLAPVFAKFDNIFTSEGIELFRDDLKSIRSDFK